jgi:hypothetical protein
MATQPLNSTNDVHHLTLRPPVVSENAELVPVSPTPWVLLGQAIAQGVSVDQLERMQAMCERWEDHPKTCFCRICGRRLRRAVPYILAKCAKCKKEN